MIACCVFLPRSGAVNPSLSLKSHCQNWSTIKSIHQQQRKHWKTAGSKVFYFCKENWKSALLSAIKMSVLCEESGGGWSWWHTGRSLNRRCAQEDVRTHTDTNTLLSPLLKRGKCTEPSQKGEIEGSIQKVGFRCKIWISMRRRHRMLVHLLQEQWLINSWMHGHAHAAHRLIFAVRGLCYLKSQSSSSGKIMTSRHY